MQLRPLLTLAVVHLISNVAFLWLGYYWLGIAEARTSSLLWSAFVAVVILCGTCWAYASALAFFKQEQLSAMTAWRAALSNLLPLALIAVALLVVYYFLARWSDYSATPALRLASFLTLEMRKPVKPATVKNIFNIVLWLVRWMILPVLLLPMIAAVAAQGWQGFRKIGGLAQKWLYWIVTPVLLYAAFVIPVKLLSWVPSVSGFSMETVSFATRAGMAYLLFIAAWLLLAFATSGGKPRLTQPNTVASL